MRSFDIEMQVVDTKELPKRARYYQSIRDTDELHKGAMYADLKDLYVLFICPDDIFGEGLPIYSFQNYAAENKNIALNDRTFKNYYIFNNYKKLPNEHPLKPYLKYFATNTPDSAETSEIDLKVLWYQTDNQTQERYMTWEQEIQLARADERERHQKIIAEKESEIAEKNSEIAEKNSEIAEKESEIAELKAKLAALGESTQKA